MTPNQQSNISTGTVKLNIAFVSREYPPSQRIGGIASYIYETATYLAKNGHKIHIIAASDNIHETEEYNDGNIHVIRLPQSDFYVCDTPSFFSKLYSHYRRIVHYRSYRKKISSCLNELIKDHDIDIVEFAEYGNEYLVWSKRQPLIPWVVRLHGSGFIDNVTGKAVSFFKSPMKYWLGRSEISGIKKATRIFSCSRILATLEAEFAQISPSLVYVVPNSVEFKQIQTDLKNAIINTHNPFTKPAKYQIFSAGSVTEGKGYGDLVRAVQILRKEGIEIALTIAGKWGSLGRTLAKEAKINAYNSWLTLLGPIPRSKLPHFYKSADLNVFPSWWESFGLVVIESMATSGLVLGSTAGGMSEIIVEGENGFLVEPHSPENLANKIHQVLLLPQNKQNCVRKNAQQTIKNNFDTSIVMDEQLNFYLSTIDKFNNK
ncbi:MAG: hypothetical protein COA36_07450 [Desulfotalea sp.]|nr:MAG: hypothetical protein COA36_07450 [Desulfotalea sp.]